jgi:hypothetical protein
MSNITLESLIQEHKERITSLRHQTSPQGSVGLGFYYYNDSQSYHKWLATTKRFIGIAYPHDKDVNEFEKVSKGRLCPEQQKELLAILEALAILPTINPNYDTILATSEEKGKESINVVANINNTNSQSQNQEQSLAVQLFIEAIKDDLTGRQIKELKALVEEANNDLQKARPSILDKISEFGSNVASNIVANILTNPTIWKGL